LAAGNYKIAAAWPGGAGYATNATFRLYDGGTFVGTFSATQSVASTYDANPYLPLQWLGTVYVGSGTLSVVLCDDADGKVVADSLSFAPADPTTAMTVKDFGAVGYTRVGTGWSDVYTGDAWGANGRSFRSATGGDYWEIPFRGVRAGSYKVEFNYAADASHNPATPVTVYLDGVAQAPVTVNETLPAGPAEYNDGAKNVGFSPVGTYSARGSLVARVTAQQGKTSDLCAVALTRLSLSGYSAPVSGAVTVQGAPSYRVDGGPPNVLTNLLWDLSGTQPYLISLLTAPIPAGASVTFSMPSAAVVLSAGAAPAVTEMPVANRSGGQALPTFDPSGSRPFKLGWNVGCPSYYDVHQTFANLMLACPKLSPISGFADPVIDANGNLVSGYARTIFRTGQANGLDPRGYRNIPAGVYTARWTGSGDMVVSGDCTLIADDGTVNGKRQKRYQVAPPDGSESCDLFVTLIGQVTRPEFWIPGVPTDGSVLFNPAYLTQLQGASVLRSMTLFGGLFNTIIDASDLTPETQLSWCEPDTFQDTFTITKFETYPNAEGFYPPQGYIPVLVTVDRPHNLVSMSMLIFVGKDGPGGTLTLPLTGGSLTSVDFNNYTKGVYYNPATMAPNQFAIDVQAPGALNGTVSAPIGTCSRARRYCPPVSAFVSLCNAVGADAWFNVPPVSPHSRSDATFTAVFRQIARTLAPGKKCYVEFANEPWNFAFPPFHYLTCLANSLKTTLMGAYASYAGHFHAIARAAFQAEGRDPKDVVGVFGTFTGVPDFTRDIAAYCRANSIPIDYVALAPYWYLQPEHQPGLDAVYDSLTTEQVIDVSEYWELWGHDVVRQNGTEHRARLAANGFASARLCCYEMGPAYARLGGSPINQGKHSQGAHKHPRFRNVMLAEWAAQQTQGHDFGCIYTSHGGYASEGGAPGTSLYAAYLGSDMLAGKGDGSDGRNDNRVDPFTVANKVSVVGQSMIDWNSTPATPVGPPNPDPTPTPNPTPNPTPDPGPTPVPVKPRPLPLSSSSPRVRQPFKPAPSPRLPRMR
ncbi:MAG: hypothetical protein U0835_25550, partial [Isosphaeraceae bacterium]